MPDTLPAELPALLRVIAPPSAGRRRREPVTAGIPLPQGAVREPWQLQVLADGSPVPLQVAVLDRWPDQSIRWALLDLQIDDGRRYELRSADPASVPGCEQPIRTRRQRGTLEVETGVATHRIRIGSNCLLESPAPQSSSPLRRVSLEIRDATDALVESRFTEVHEETTGPMRSTVRLVGFAGTAANPLCRLTARLHFFAGLTAARIELTLLNDRRAQHQGGYWELGDPGSILFRDVCVRVDGFSEDSSDLLCSLSSSDPSFSTRTPLELYQDSSGGDNGHSRVHLNRDGRIPARFQGYELRYGQDRRTGARATPVVWRSGTAPFAAVVPGFWQNFPKALEVTRGEWIVRLFPRQFADLHELQAGEQKTHAIGLSFGSDEVSDPPLDWLRAPSILTADPEWYAACEAVPYLITSDRDPHHEHLELVNSAIEGEHAFERKREIIDEFGWRHFGDIYADHEAKGQPPGTFVSHYNNQYDAIAGFAIQFMRSGDARWWTAMEELAAHVVDIDLYHTTRDKAAYSGGQFWHTTHYVDAGRSSHRGYPRADAVDGGGPSNEQNYSTGLMLHHFLTGRVSSREAVLQLAEWTIAMDDGNRTVFRWLSRGATGLASSSGSTMYHGPGRGAANSIVTLLNAFRLTGHSRVLAKVEELIRRCIHPGDDLKERQLLDTERRWSYTVFLQALGRYLDEKILRDELDCRYAYARASLRHYARWMAEYEYPYLEKPSTLEFPTETWAAQDMRKSEVFKFASRHGDGPERDRYIERSEFFFQTSLAWLRKFPSRTCTRPVVLMLSYGHMHAAWTDPSRVPQAPPGPSNCDFGRPERFVPQRALARRRAIVLAVATSFVLATAVVWLLT